MMRGVIVCLATAAGLAAPGCSARPPSPHPGSVPADSFLAKYVTSHGRVLRHDQGDDIVSEGQAYGMLIAETRTVPTRCARSGPGRAPTCAGRTGC
jgi:hypothetical protein